MAKKDFLPPTLRVMEGMSPLPTATVSVRKHAPLLRAYNIVTHYLHQLGIHQSECDYRYDVLDARIEEGVETGRFLASVHDGQILIEFVNNISTQEIHDRTQTGVLSGSYSLRVNVADEETKSNEKYGVAKVVQMAYSQFAQVWERILLDFGYVIGTNKLPHERNTIEAYCILPLTCRVRIHFPEERVEVIVRGNYHDGQVSPLF